MRGQDHQVTPNAPLTRCFLTIDAAMEAGYTYALGYGTARPNRRIIGGVKIKPMETDRNDR